MPKPRLYQTPALIIRKVKLGEADRILTLYTPELGKIEGVAKAVRRPNSRLSGHLELLTYSQVTLARGRNIDTVIGSQTINSFLPVKSDLEKVSCGLYLLEMVNQFTPEATPDPGLFEFLLGTLERLAAGAEYTLLLRYFELNLLRRAGYRPELDRCVLCRVPLGVGPSAFSPAAGGLVCSSCRHQHYGYEVSRSTLALLRRLQEGDWESLTGTAPRPSFVREGGENLYQAAPEDFCLREAGEIMRRYVRYLLERDIRSAAWLDNLEHQFPAV
jgi:DNA repair protein RecO (recombination protein O)